MRVGGVPEHYNAPIHRLMANLRGEIEWVSFPSGTGAMLDALDRNEIDLAILLTEGVSKHALTTGKTRIVGTFVNNPLPWGVHVKPDGPLSSMEVLNSRIGDLTFGISRLGSGSHLMAIVHAASLGPNSVPRFKIVDNMKGARDAMVNGEIDVFLWDITTADIFAREGVWKVVGTVSGDWPAFVFATQATTNNTDDIESLIQKIKEEAIELKQDRSKTSVVFLMETFGISETQAGDFITSIEWNCTRSVDKEALLRVVDALEGANIIPNRSDIYSIDSIVLQDR